MEAYQTFLDETSILEPVTKCRGGGKEHHMYPKGGLKACASSFTSPKQQLYGFGELLTSAVQPRLVHLLLGSCLGSVHPLEAWL